MMMSKTLFMTSIFCLMVSAVLYGTGSMCSVFFMGWFMTLLMSLTTFMIENN